MAEKKTKEQLQQRKKLLLRKQELLSKAKKKKPETSKLVDAAGLISSITGGPAVGALAVRGAEKLTGKKGSLGRPQEVALRNLVDTGLLGLPNLATGGKFTPEPTTAAESFGALAGDDDDSQSARGQRATAISRVSA